MSIMGEILCPKCKCPMQDENLREYCGITYGLLRCPECRNGRHWGYDLAKYETAEIRTRIKMSLQVKETDHELEMD